LRPFPFTDWGLFLFIAALASAAVATFLNARLVDDVNRKLPESLQFSQFWWYRAKHIRLFHEHRRLYPQSRLRLIWILTFVAIFSCGIAAFVVAQSSH